MTRALRVFSWQGFHRDAPGHGNQVRWLVAAHSKAEVKRLTGAKESDLFNFGVTANVHDVKAACAQPLTLLWRGLDEREPNYRVHEILRK